MKPRDSRGLWASAKGLTLEESPPDKASGGETSSGGHTSGTTSKVRRAGELGSLALGPPADAHQQPRWDIPSTEELAGEDGGGPQSEYLSIRAPSIFLLVNSPWNSECLLYCTSVSSTFN